MRQRAKCCSLIHCRSRANHLCALASPASSEMLRNTTRDPNGFGDSGPQRFGLRCQSWKLKDNVRRCFPASALEANSPALSPESVNGTILVI